MVLFFAHNYFQKQFFRNYLPYSADLSKSQLIKCACLILRDVLALNTDIFFRLINKSPKWTKAVPISAFWDHRWRKSCPTVRQIQHNHQPMFCLASFVYVNFSNIFFLLFFFSVVVVVLSLYIYNILYKFL